MTGWRRRSGSGQRSGRGKRSLTLSVVILLSETTSVLIASGLFQTLLNQTTGCVGPDVVLTGSFVSVNFSVCTILTQARESEDSTQFHILSNNSLQMYNLLV